MPNTLALYNGTTHDFAEIDVRRGKSFKDFGQGFYLAESYERACNIAVRNRRIEENRLRVIGDETVLHVFVYSYEFDLLEMNKLNVKRFDTADHEWLRFIIANRMNRTRQHDYDNRNRPNGERRYPRLNPCRYERGKRRDFEQHRAQFADRNA